MPYVKVGISAALVALFLFIMPIVWAHSEPLEAQIQSLSEDIEQKSRDASATGAKVRDLKRELDLSVSNYAHAYADLQAVELNVIAREKKLNAAVEQQAFYQAILDEFNIFTYREGDVFFLDVMLGTSSFSDLLVRLDYIARINQRQIDVLGRAKRLRARIEHQRDQLAREKASQLELVDTLEKQQELVNRLLQEQEAFLAATGNEIEKLEAEKEQKKAEQADARSRAAAMLQELGAGSYSIEMIFPVQKQFASSYINDWGFPRAGNRAGHQGTDIFAQKGTPLVAVVDGVIGPEFGNSRIGGYRLHIIDAQGIDYYYAHLNNDTLNSDDGVGGYAAAFAPGIAPGIMVKAGQVIGYMGDSGDAETTPPHLHFGIQVNGQWINPFPHLKVAEFR